MSETPAHVEENSGERRNSAPGRFETVLHGSCPKCHHWHDKVSIWLNEDPNLHNEIKCQNVKCQHKMFGLGGNSSHFSLLSRETLESNGERPRIPIACTNDFTIVAAFPAYVAPALAAPTPNIANALPQSPTQVQQSERVDDDDEEALRGELPSATRNTTQTEPLSGEYRQGMSSALNIVQSEPPPSNVAGQPKRKRLQSLRSRWKKVVAAFGFEITIRRIPRGGTPQPPPTPMDIQAPPAPLLSDNVGRNNESTSNDPPKAPRTTFLQPETENVDTQDLSRSATLRGTTTVDRPNSEVATSQGEDTSHRCVCPKEPEARQAWINERRRNKTLEEHAKFCQCSLACDCYQYHYQNEVSDMAEASSSRPSSDHYQESGDDGTRASSVRPSESILYSHLGGGTVSEPHSPHDSIMSGSQHSHRHHDQSRTPNRSSTGSTQQSSSNESSNPSNRSERSRNFRRTPTMMTNETMSTLDTGNMAPLPENQEDVRTASPVRNSEDSAAMPLNPRTNGYRTPPQEQNDEDDMITPTAPRRNATWSQ